MKPPHLGPSIAPRRPLNAVLCALLCLVCGLGLAHAGDPPAAMGDLDDSWRLVSDRNDIQVYMRHRDDSRLKTFRGVTRMTLRDQYAMVAVLEDYASYPRWLHFVDGAEEFDRQSPLLRYLRFTTHLPWPLANREAVLQADVVQAPGGPEGGVAIHLRNRPELLPPTDRYVRFPEMDGLLAVEFLGGDEIELTYQLIMDAGGYIPAWLSNILLRDAPYFTLDRLRRIVLRPEYQGQYYDYLDLRGPGRPADPVE
ncbi:START domain-containing protein [Isoalcanivorax indicus]|uniref:START domain-containing protein n=1 Tax=Isoalcanivorax indicus TaxID=2202653 RepID=UPI001B872B00|nr:START domain-containing protein [Isoalcanivorax indicus]